MYLLGFPSWHFQKTPQSTSSGKVPYSLKPICGVILLLIMIMMMLTMIMIMIFKMMMTWGSGQLRWEARSLCGNHTRPDATQRTGKYSDVIR